MYDRKNAFVVADLLNDRVIPFYDLNDVKLLRILTDGGGKCKGAIPCHRRDRPYFYESKIPAPYSKNSMRSLL